MQLIDEAIIEVIAGHGGNGCMAFRREKYCPRGGPSGGDGGKGGDVYLVAEHNLSTLLDLRYRRIYRAKSGEHGRGKDQHGRGGEDCEIFVPTGTMVFDHDSGQQIGDMIEHGQYLLVAKGGRGGMGNMRFVTSTRQAPDFATPGLPGEMRNLKLELKMLADVGIIGFPNVGKSTLISKLSAARPKIAEYAFTTLSPNLGVVTPPHRRSFVVADVPGLVPGAHQGVGLGLRFLRHIERTRLFLHLLELSDDPQRDPICDFEVICQELSLYDRDTGSQLTQNPTIVAINKLEDPEMAELCIAEYAPYFAQRGIPFFAISAHSGANLPQLLQTIADILEQHQPQIDDPATTSWHPLEP